MKLIIVKDKAEIGKTVGEMFINAVKKNPNLHVGLATGSSPITTYEYIINDFKKNHTDWSRVISFNLDEYVGLVPTHDQSYRYFMNENLFDHINIIKENTFVPKGTGDYEAYASKYDDLIAKNGGVDIQLLGVGANGHVGFNEPPTDFNSRTRVVNLVESTIKANSRFFASINDVPKQAVSMGIKTIMEAKEIILIANGTNKAEAIKALIEGPVTNNVPCTILQKHPYATIVVDEEAASLLKNKG